MRLTRRGFVAGASALSLARMARANGAEVLRAEPGTAQLADGYPPSAIWGYGGTVPGPVIRVQQGGRVVRRFDNGLPQPSTVHWHGIRIDNAMDGVPELTQAVVEPGAEFLYDFTVPDAGTYWYHPHNRTWEQLARGLYGALIVEEADPPPVDRDEVLLIDDWRMQGEAEIAGGFGAMMDWSHAGRIGNWVTVNGDGAWSLPVKRHERLRLRLANTANARVMTLTAQGLEGWVVALDGQPLETPEPLGQLVLAPAQRADVIADVTAEAGGEALLVSIEREGGYAIASLPVAGTAREARMEPPGPLAPNPVPPLGDPATARRVRLTMEGGAMGRMASAMLDGAETDIRTLAGKGKVWAFNGRADMPDEPLVEAARGETVVIEMVNDTAWPHAMHLHGHHFRVLGPDGAPGPLRDTALVERGETAAIAFVADNPGDWLIHCHMVEHAAAGMMTWLRVAA